jgi:hypothetical protein
MVLLPQGLQALKKVAKEVGLDLRGAYLNLDGGFDSAHNRRVCPTFYTLGNSTRWGPFSLKSATSQERDFIA